MQPPKDVLATVETIVRKSRVCQSYSRSLDEPSSVSKFRFRVQRTTGIIVFHDSRLEPTAASCVVQVSVVRIPRASRRVSFHRHRCRRAVEQAQFHRPLCAAAAAGILELDVGKIYDPQRRQRTTIWHRFWCLSRSRLIDLSSCCREKQHGGRGSPRGMTGFFSEEERVQVEFDSGEIPRFNFWRAVVAHVASYVAFASITRTKIFI